MTFYSFYTHLTIINLILPRVEIIYMTWLQRTFKHSSSVRGTEWSSAQLKGGFKDITRGIDKIIHLYPNLLFDRIYKEYDDSVCQCSCYSSSNVTSLLPRLQSLLHVFPCSKHLSRHFRGLLRLPQFFLQLFCTLSHLFMHLLFFWASARSTIEQIRRITRIFRCNENVVSDFVAQS